MFRPALALLQSRAHLPAMVEPTPKVALITGAARRIGAVIARDLGRRGWAVAVHYRGSAAEAETVVADIQAGGGQAAAFAADLMSEAETTSLVGRACDTLGRVTCLINNASLFERDEPLTVTRDSWDRHMQVNLRAPFLLTQTVARQIPPHGSGCVINILDQRVWNLTPHFTTYTVSKAGLWTLTQTLALALAPRLRVNAVAPGPTLPSQRQTAEQFVRQWSNVPLARPVAPEEISAAVCFLLDAPSVTGQMIAVDAGQHLGWRCSVSKEAGYE
jgi:NAD(P)-dependent dehydrogenase (short-subunit alcohol dehydrogenase family)